MSILGKPIHVCPYHVGPLACGCMGVYLTDKESLDSSAPARQDTCAVCAATGLQDGWRPRRLLRKCKKHRCSGGCYRTTEW